MGRVKRGLSAGPKKVRCRQHRSKRVFLVTLLGLGIFTGAAGLTAWTRTAPLFQLSTIDVGGNRMVPSQLALKLVPVETGTNIFAVDLEAIKRAMQQDPRIREVTIRRQLPSKIIITIHEREPVMLISADRFYGLDEEGMVIHMDQEKGLEDIPVLTGIFPQVQPGAGPSLLDKISEINVARPEDPLLYLIPDAVQVRLGSGDLHAKLRRLWVVLGDLAARGISVKSLDLRFKDQLICQPAS